MTVRVLNRPTFLMATFAILAVQAFVQAQVPATQADGRTAQRTRTKWVQVQNAMAPHVPVVPLPITQREIDRYAEILELSDAQVKYLAAHFANYLQRCDALDNEWAAKLAFTHDVDESQADTLDFYDRFVQWQRTEQQFVEAIAVEDDRLFTALDLVLADPQRERLPRVKLPRQRNGCRSFWAGMLGAKTDLSGMIEKMPWPPEEKSLVDPVLVEYEIEFTPLLLKAERGYRDASINYHKYKHDVKFDSQGVRLNRNDPETKKYILQVLEKMDAALPQHLELQRPLVAVNERFLPRIVAALPPTDGEIIRQLYLSKAYLRVYPDDIDPSDLYRKIISDKGLSENVKAALDAEWQRFRTEYDAVCKDMVDASKAWHQETLKYTMSTQWPAHNYRMTELQDRRDKADERFVSTLRALVSNDVLTRKESALAVWDEAHRRHEQERIRQKQEAMYPDVR